MSNPTFFPTLGARILQDEEIKLSLPTYRKLLDQIDTIRKNAIDYQDAQTKNSNSQNTFLRPQVINNLSILGSRGSGKSSVLKTLYRHLEKEKNKNILLPPIVPENLESHMTLMSSLLGLLNEQIMSLPKKQQSSCPICPSEKEPLEKEYHKLVEHYVHLQKPYQDISIQKYSTESDYVRTMSNVFEAGNQFSVDLWNFIDLLLGRYEKDTLLFVFIDDIDLSTYRCFDVVRTLLGYISHPRVITILAGDIEVFGEALTLDFLRQEKLLGKNGIMESYTVSQMSSGNEKKLLNRKKELAYEYLKKVMPPMNRHSLSTWSLNNRGNFCPVGLYDSASKEDIPSLQAILAKTNQLHPLLTGYFSAPEDGESASDQVLYHLFDSTARGLINCYIPIKQLLSQSNENPFENIKFTLEAIVFSNFALNALRDLIFSRFLQIGADRASTYILFNNFNDWTDQQLLYLMSYGTLAKEDIKKDAKEKAETVISENPVSLERELSIFQIFVYLDWAARLLGEEDVLKGEDYNTAKERALFLLCANGSISERTDELPADDRVQLYRIGLSKSNTLIYPNCAAAIAFRCFFRLSFPLAVRYFCSFHVPQMLEILSNYAENKYTETGLDKLQRIVDFIDVLKRFYHYKNGDKDNLLRASARLAEQNEMLELITSQLKSDQNAMLVSVICNNYFKTGDQEHSSNKNETLSPLYRQYCKNGISWKLFLSYIPHRIRESENFDESNLNRYFGNPPKLHLSKSAAMVLHDFLTNIGADIEPPPGGYPKTSAQANVAVRWYNLFEQSGDSSGAAPIYNFYSEYFWKEISNDLHRVKPLADKYKDISQQAKKLCGNELKSTNISDMEQRLKVLFAIDSGDLWTLNTHGKKDESPIGQIKTYILQHLKDCENKLVPDLCNYEFKIDVSGTKDAFQQLDKAYKGDTYTLAKKCTDFLSPIFPQRSSRDPITVSEYIYARCVLERLINSYAWYGQWEARQLLSALDQASIVLPENFDSTVLGCYTFWFHCYCRYRVAELSDETYTLVEQAYSAMPLIQEAEKMQDQQNKETYQENMRKKGQLDDDLIQQIPKLFENRRFL